MMRSHHLMSRTSEAGSRFFHGVTSPEATADGSGALSPLRGGEGWDEGDARRFRGAVRAQNSRNSLPESASQGEGKPTVRRPPRMYLTNRSSPYAELGIRVIFCSAGLC